METEKAFNHLLGMRVIADAERQKAERALSQLASLKSSLEKVTAAIDSSLKVRHGRWFVLLKRKDDGWEFVGIFDPLDEDKVLPEDGWDLSMQIPDIETVPESKGW